MANPTTPAANDNMGVGRKCAICGQPAQTAYKPFCSKRCADVDLSRWLKGTYAIPVMEIEENLEEDR
jgi:uncharacterized protein